MNVMDEVPVGPDILLKFGAVIHACSAGATGCLSTRAVGYCMQCLIYNYFPVITMLNDNINATNSRLMIYSLNAIAGFLQ